MAQIKQETLQTPATPTTPRKVDLIYDILTPSKDNKQPQQDQPLKLLSAVCSAIRLHETTNTPLAEISPTFSSDLESLIVPLPRKNLFNSNSDLSTSKKKARRTLRSFPSSGSLSSFSSLSESSASSFSPNKRGNTQKSSQGKRTRKKISPNKKSPKSVGSASGKGRRKSNASTGTKSVSRKGSSSHSRKKRKNEWIDEEIILLLQVTKLMLDCELKSVAKALFELIERSPGKSAGRAAEKKLKRMEIFENWKKCDAEETKRRIDKKLEELGAKEASEKVIATAAKYRKEEMEVKLGVTMR